MFGNIYSNTSIRLSYYKYVSNNVLYAITYCIQKQMTVQKGVLLLITYSIEIFSTKYNHTCCVIFCIKHNLSIRTAFERNILLNTPRVSAHPLSDSFI